MRIGAVKGGGARDLLPEAGRCVWRAAAACKSLSPTPPSWKPCQPTTTATAQQHSSSNDGGQWAPTCQLPEARPATMPCRSSGWRRKSRPSSGPCARSRSSVLPPSTALPPPACCSCCRCCRRCCPAPAGASRPPSSAGGCHRRRSPKSPADASFCGGQAGVCMGGVLPCCMAPRLHPHHAHARVPPPYMYPACMRSHRAPGSAPAARTPTPRHVTAVGH